MKLDDFLKKYDLVHANLVNGGKVRININFFLDNRVELSILNNGILDDKSIYSTTLNSSFKYFALPKVVQRFLSKGNNFSKRTIMGGNELGTIVVENDLLNQSLVIRNADLSMMDFMSRMLLSMLDLSNFQNDIFKKYLACNIAFDYAKYKTKFVTKIDNLSFYNYSSKKNYSDKANDSDEFTDCLAILDIARCAISINSFEYDTLIAELNKTYKNDKVVLALCKKFIANDFSKDTIYTRAYICASFEKYNEEFLNNNSLLIDEAIDAASCGVNYFSDEYDEYWNERSKYFKALNDIHGVDLCDSFYKSRILVYEEVDMNNETITKDLESRSKDKNKVINSIKRVKNNRPNFSSIINNPLEADAVNIAEEEKKNENTLFMSDDDIKLSATKEANKLYELIKQRDQIKKDAEEFAKMILKSEKERKKIAAEAMEQAKIIYELKKENDLLRSSAMEIAKKLYEQNNKVINNNMLYDSAKVEAKRLFEKSKDNSVSFAAKEMAKQLYDRNTRLAEENRLREKIDNTPVKNSDIDKVQDLLNAISNVKDLDFAINHPTIMQELSILEEKIITYLMTHVNVVETENTMLPIDQQEMYETKSVDELLFMIRNAYSNSHMYEKDGRHTLINVNPVDEDTYKVTLYSVKDDEDDILMDAFFEDYQFTEDVLKEICDIFKANAFIVASKTDNIPGNKADYLVIDNMNNAIKFMGCNRDLISIVKTYL